MIGKLQTNKVKLALQLFDYIHSVDSKKLAKKIADEQLKSNKKIKIFLQVNIGDENQKSGINKNEIYQLAHYCKEIGLEVIGLMCIPPLNVDPQDNFEEMQKISKALAEQGKKADDEEMFDIALDLLTKNFVSNENNKLN